MRTDFIKKKLTIFLRLQCQTEVAFSAVPKRMLFATRRKMIQLAFTKTTLGMVAKTGRLSKRHILKIFRKSRLSGSEYNFLISFLKPVNVCKPQRPCFLHSYPHRRPAPLFYSDSLIAFWVLHTSPGFPFFQFCMFQISLPWMTLLSAPPSRNFSKLSSLTLLFPSSLPSQHLTLKRLSTEPQGPPVSLTGISQMLSCLLILSFTHFKAVSPATKNKYRK